MQGAENFLIIFTQITIPVKVFVLASSPGRCRSL